MMHCMFHSFIIILILTFCCIYLNIITFKFNFARNAKKEICTVIVYVFRLLLIIILFYCLKIITIFSFLFLPFFTMRCLLRSQVVYVAANG